MSTIETPRALTPIKDPLHGNIQATVFEREIIDSRQFQQLHHILQNSTVYAGYPNNKVSRFIHSIGVCHLAGSMFTNSVSNASSNDLRDFLSSAATLVDQMYISILKNFFPTNTVENFLNGWEGSICGASKFTHHPHGKDSGKLVLGGELFYSKLGSNNKGKGKDGYPALFLLDTFWQATRIAGLLHDIGHLPMSHSFEGGIAKTSNKFGLYSNQKITKSFSEFYDRKTKQVLTGGSAPFDEFFQDKICQILNIPEGQSQEVFEYYSEKIPLHKARTLAISHALNTYDKYDLKEKYFDVYIYRQMALDLALVVLFSSIGDHFESSSLVKNTLKDVPGVLRFIKMIIASEADADRLDYVARDAQASDSNFGHFDVNDIVSSVKLVKNNDAYKLSFYYRSIPSLEHFFGQRRDGYKHLIYHRVGARSEACLQELISRLIFVSYENPPSDLAGILDKWGFIRRTEDSGAILDLVPLDSNNFKEFDDSCLRACFIEIYSLLNTEEYWKKLRFNKKNTNPKNQVLILRCLLEIILFREFSHIVSPFKSTNLKTRVERILRGSFNDITENQIKEVYKGLVTKLSGRLEEVDDDVESELEKQFRARFSGEVICIAQELHAKNYNWEFLKDNKLEAELLVCHDGCNNLSMVHENSSYLASMEKRAISDFDYRVYFIGESLKKDKGDVLKTCNGVLDKVIKKYVLKWSELK